MSPIWLTFDGPLVLQDNSRAINYSMDYNVTGKTIVPHSGAAVHAAHTMLLVNGPTTISGHPQGAVALFHSTASFSGAVTARNNRVSGGYIELLAFAVLALLKAQATFQNRFICDQDAKEPEADVSSTCIAAWESSLEFRGTVTASNNPSTKGAPVLHCSGSVVRFRGRAVFKGNSRRYVWVVSWMFSGYSDSDASGGAWNMRNCRVVADKRVEFYNNSAVTTYGSGPELPPFNTTTYGAGGAISVVESSLLFKGGLDVVGNTAPRGGGLYLAGSLLKVSGGRFVCKDNVAARQGGCMYATSSSAILINTTSSCVQNNSAFNETAPAANGMYIDESNGYTGTCLAAVAVVDSKVNFAGPGHNFGNNYAADGSPGCDIVVFTAHNPFYNVSNAGLTCNGAYKRTFGAYTIGGDVCAGNCSNSSCACPPPAKWAEADCKCM
jgi:hypothetical protein